jgi:hypothetical protein
VCWYRRDKDTGVRTLIKCVPLEGGEFTLSITTDEIDYIIEAEGVCPDSEPFPIDETEPVIPDTTSYNYVRWTGYKKEAGKDRVDITSEWKATGANPSDYWTVQGLAGCAGGRTLLQTYEHPTQGWSVNGPSIGPVPWRASVRTVQSGDGQVGNLGIGGLAFNTTGNPCSSVSSNQPQLSVLTLESGYVNEIVGKWQFSDDQVIVELEWLGDTDSVDPVDEP